MIVKYIVWKTTTEDNLESHIIAVCNNLPEAESIRSTLLKNQEGDENNEDYCDLESDNILFSDCTNSSLNNSNQISIKLIDIDDNCHTIYFLKIEESRGGGRYHEVSYLYACSSMDMIIDFARDYFDNEHNRDEENECLQYADAKLNANTENYQCQCFEHLVESLKKNQRSCDIHYTTFMVGMYAFTYSF
jgi:hypothetical protein